jgi:hypothetical protein
VDRQPTVPDEATSPGPSSAEGTVVPMADEWAAGVGAHRVESRRSGRLRWGIAGAIVVVVVALTTAGAAVLSGAGGAKSLTASLAPKDSVFFMEVRTDLPGDQRSNLAAFMSYFPGFKDQSQFDNALDGLLNMLTAAVSPDLQYTSAFKPWMEGEVSVAVEDFGPSTAPSSATCSDVWSAAGWATAAGRIPSAVATFALKDRAAAASWVGGEVARLKLSATPQSYGGTTINVLGGMEQGAYALTDQDLLLGTVAGVKAALDTATKGSLADSTNYQAAMKPVSQDSLARFYVDPKTLISGGIGSYVVALCRMPGVVAASLPRVNSASMPEWVAGSIRAESGRIVVETDMPRPAGTPTYGNHESQLAGSLPGSTVATFQAHSIGQALEGGINALESASPSAGIGPGQIGSLQNALAAIGGVDWLGDGTAVVTRDGASFGGGLVIEAPDAATARSKLGTITGLVGLSGIVAGVKSRTESYQGSTITVVSVPASIAGTDVALALAAKDNLVVAGYTDAFVKAVLDTTPANSLASQADYAAVMAAAGTSNEASGYVNVPALADTLGTAVLQRDSQRWNRDYKPYFDHLGGVAFSVIDGSTITIRLVVTAR